MVNEHKYRSNLKKIRLARGLTAKELSEKAGLKQLKRVSDIEDGRGDPKLREIMSIAKVLDVSFEAMLEQIILIGRYLARLILLQPSTVKTTR
jgi:transcriptional regulator with XRE-family HTH domain